MWLFTGTEAASLFEGESEMVNSSIARSTLPNEVMKSHQQFKSNKLIHSHEKYCSS